MKLRLALVLLFSLGAAGLWMLQGSLETAARDLQRNASWLQGEIRELLDLRQLDARVGVDVERAQIARLQRPAAEERILREYEYLRDTYGASVRRFLEERQGMLRMEMSLQLPRRDQQALDSFLHDVQHPPPGLAIRLTRLGVQAEQVALELVLEIPIATGGA